MCDEIIKPKLRGYLHAYAFICTLIATLIFIFTSFWKKFDLGILIYLISQLLQFGVSACYHIVSWPPKIKKFFRHLDHICIFILISGTQTSVALNIEKVKKSPSSRIFILSSWLISILGIMKILIMRKLHNIFDLVVYIAHGAIIIPFYNLYKGFQFDEKLLCVLGGLFYILGGVIYGFEKPNPSPKMFGYHEIFHLFTIFANFCFGVMITKNYIMNLAFNK